ncbi:MAG: PH domain-containing protein [Christensenellales bacterium]
MENIFDLILDKDETIVEIFKPNKVKTYFKSIFCMTIFLLFFMVPFCLSLFIPEEGYEPLSAIWCLLPIGIFLICEIVFILLLNLHYKKTFYAYTNKRILIRTGVIGVDYKCLDLKSIGAMDVYVSLLDKIVGKNTGTLRFGSMSSPITNGATSYMFAHITSPYEVYKRLKEYKENSNN